MGRSFVELVRQPGRVASARAHSRPGHAPSHLNPQQSAIIALQRTAGNEAVAKLLRRFPVQRCGPVPCHCSDEERDAAPVQRDPKVDPSTTAPRDVVLILVDPRKRADAVTEAKVIAPGGHILFATSVAELASQLRTVTFPVRTLFFVGHSNADGDIVFETAGQEDFVPASKVAAGVRGVIKVENIDFRGCAVAVSPKALDDVRVALGAKKVKGSTCELVKQVAGPITVSGKKIEDRATFDLSKPANRKVFDAGMKKLRDAFGDDRKKCIVNDSEDGYFAAGGRLLAVWANPESISGQDAFDKDKSVCYASLKTVVIDPKKPPVIDEEQCKLISLK